MSFEPCNEGIGMMRDAKPQMFSVDDSCFIYDLVTNVSRL